MVLAQREVQPRLGVRREMGIVVPKVRYYVFAYHGPVGVPTVVLDLFDRKVVGWALSGDMEAGHTTIPAMEMAFANRKARERLIFHSDRGGTILCDVFPGSAAGAVPLGSVASVTKQSSERAVPR
jgi:transposase InsO family protein